MSVQKPTNHALLNAVTADPKLAPEEAAEYLGVAPGTLMVWRSTGRYNLPFLKVGRLVRYRKSDLDAWLERRTHRHTGNAA